MLHFSMRQGEQAQISFSCMNFDDNDSEDVVMSMGEDEDGESDEEMGEDEDGRSDEDTSEDDETDEDTNEDVDERMNSVVFARGANLTPNELQRVR